VSIAGPANLLLTSGVGHQGVLKPLRLFSGHISRESTEGLGNVRVSEMMRSRFGCG
jgi:hypothetical protein